MAILGKGIFGNVSGKIGNVQGSRWKGRDTLQSYNEKGNTNVTNAVLFQREYFSQLRKIAHIATKNGFGKVWKSKNGKLPAYCEFLKFQKRLPNYSVIRSVAYSYLSPQKLESLNQRSLSSNTTDKWGRYRWWNTNPATWDGGNTLVGVAIFSFIDNRYEMYFGVARASSGEVYIYSDFFGVGNSIVTWVFFHNEDLTKISPELGRWNGFID